MITYNYTAPEILQGVFSPLCAQNILIRAHDNFLACTPYNQAYGVRGINQSRNVHIKIRRTRKLSYAHKYHFLETSGAPYRTHTYTHTYMTKDLFLLSNGLC